MTKNWKNFTAEKNYIFLSKISIYLSQGFHKGRPKLQEKPSALQHFQTFLYSFLFLWVMFAFLDPDPDKATQINADPDPKPCFKANLSTYLL
jgi:hypothetical protein